MNSQRDHYMHPSLVLCHMDCDGLNCVSELARLTSTERSKRTKIQIFAYMSMRSKEGNDTDQKKMKRITTRTRIQMFAYVSMHSKEGNDTDQKKMKRITTRTRIQMFAYV
eukprot:886358_1